MSAITKPAIPNFQELRKHFENDMNDLDREAPILKLFTTLELARNEGTKVLRGCAKDAGYSDNEVDQMRPKGINIKALEHYLDPKIDALREKINDKISVNFRQSFEMRLDDYKRHIINNSVYDH